MNITETPLKNKHSSGIAWRSVPLTRKEIHTLILFSEGKTNRRVAKILDVDCWVIDTRSKRLQNRLGFRYREAMVEAFRKDNVLADIPIELYGSILGDGK